MPHLLAATETDLDPIAEAEALKLAHLSLDALTAEAKLCQDKIAAAKGRVAKVRAEALANACAMGHRLLAIKRKLPRQFGAWIKISDLEVSQKTAERYMGLAQKSSHVSKLPVGTSLRKAYIAVGIITPKKPDSLVQEIRAQVIKLRNLMSKKSGKINPADCAPLMMDVRSLRSDCNELIKKINRSRAGHRVKTRSRNTPILTPDLVGCLVYSGTNSPLAFFGPF